MGLTTWIFSISTRVIVCSLFHLDGVGADVSEDVGRSKLQTSLWDVPLCHHYHLVTSHGSRCSTSHGGSGAKRLCWPRAQVVLWQQLTPQSSAGMLWRNSHLPPMPRVPDPVGCLRAVLFGCESSYMCSPSPAAGASSAWPQVWLFSFLVWTEQSMTSRCSQRSELCWMSLAASEARGLLLRGQKSSCVFRVLVLGMVLWDYVCCLGATCMRLCVPIEIHRLPEKSMQSVLVFATFWHDDARCSCWSAHTTRTPRRCGARRQDRAGTLVLLFGKCASSSNTWEWDYGMRLRQTVEVGCPFCPELCGWEQVWRPVVVPVGVLQENGGSGWWSRVKLGLFLPSEVLVLKCLQYRR